MLDVVMVSHNFHVDFITLVTISSYFQIVSCTNSTTEATSSETSNNATWLIIGVGAAFFLLLLAIIVGGIVYAIHKKKRIHPHSDTESFYSETSDQDYKSRPTTASHIFIDPGDEAMSKPVPMTPFELRKLYVETFPYSKWRKGFDGALRPQMPLKFVEPNLYRRTKQDESKFRQSIFSYEMPDTLTLRSAAPSRLMTRSNMRPGSNLEPIMEKDHLGKPTSETQQTEAVVHFTGIEQAAEDKEKVEKTDDIQSRIMSGDDTEL